MTPVVPRIVTSVGIVALVAGCSRASEPAPAPAASGSAASASVAPSASAAPAFPVAQASVDYVLNPAGLPPYAGPTGSVEGTVTVTGPAAPNVTLDTGKCPASLDTYGKLFREGTPAKPGGPRPLADAVVVVVGYEGYYVPEKNDAVHLTVGSNCAYPSRTIAITYGQRLEISNKSDMLFAPVIDQASTPAVMVAPPKENGDPVRIYPHQAGYFTLTDRMQPYVREDLYVFRHPLHAVTDVNGHYRIDGVPVGKLKVGVKHPSMDAANEVPVEVAASVVQPVDVTLTYKPKPPPKVFDAGLPPKRLQND